MDPRESRSAMFEVVRDQDPNQPRASRYTRNVGRVRRWTSRDDILALLRVATYCRRSADSCTVYRNDQIWPLSDTRQKIISHGDVFLVHIHAVWSDAPGDGDPDPDSESSNVCADLRRADLTDEDEGEDEEAHPTDPERVFCSTIASSLWDTIFYAVYQPCQLPNLRIPESGLLLPEQERLAGSMR